MSQRMLNRRRRKLINFLIAEASAIGVLFLAGAIGLSLKPADPTLALSANIVTIAAAAAVAIIPIAFFAITPILPRGHRYSSNASSSVSRSRARRGDRALELRSNSLALLRR
jgi:hypothetical protein